MKNLKIPKINSVIILLLLVFMSHLALAQPTFQVYSPDAVYGGDYYQDQDTWFVVDNPFDIEAIGAYHTNTFSLDPVRLIFSVPEADELGGTITITAKYPGDDGVPALFGVFETTSFLPSTFNSHYPLKDDVSDFIVFDIGAFFDNEEPIYDYNADDDGDPPLTGSTGQVKEYEIYVSGYEWVHIDMYGLETSNIDSKWKYSWEMNPGSHDVTWIPAPGSIFLGSIGIALVGWLRRRRTL